MSWILIQVNYLWHDAHKKAITQTSQNPQLFLYHLLSARLKGKFCTPQIPESGIAYIWISKHHRIDAVN